MHTLTATTTQKHLLPVDGRGVAIIEALAGLSDREAASATREAIDALLGVRMSVVAAVSTSDHAAPGVDAHGAVVTIREVTDAGVEYRTATATGASGGEAVGRAVLDTFATETSLIDAAAARWSLDADVRSVTVVRDHECRSLGRTDESDRHRQLSATMPAAGVLAADTAGARYRVVRLPEVAIACTLAPSTRVTTRFDAWVQALQGRVRC